MPGRTASPEPTLDIMSKEEEDTLEQIRERRHQLIQPLWEKYEQGHYNVIPDDQPESTIELIKSSDLRVERRGDLSKGQLSSIHVAHNGAKEFPGVNFIGFEPTQQCLAFRGEARHLDSFIDFSNAMVKGERVQFVFKAPAAAVIPKAGFRKNLDYDEFAGQVEIVEYAMWLRPPSPEDEASSYPPDDLVMLSPDEDDLFEHSEPVSSAATCEEQGNVLPMDVDDQSPEPLVPNSKRYSTDSTLSDIPEEQEEISFDGRQQGNTVNIADQDDEMIDGNALQVGACTDCDAKEADKLASQLEADAALAASLSQSLTNTTRYTLRKRSSTQVPEEAVNPTKSSGSKTAEASKENGKTLRATSTAKQPAKKTSKKANTGQQARKNKPRRQ
ncbi:unnamed protein product [Clonostachys rosea f. rosea IK726]|uniref:Uncharacterized protein n=1 Tax=Clonostachys rosea f. rosea IK726 TaxID=1349383 RepID=A0ACA9TT98_BIOOC|nr:unnamed protein product [Clonostachys rosea f. rosea IK726]